jgi:hypothetical protein
MELTRRDAAAALAALGVGGVAVGSTLRSWDDDHRRERADPETIHETLVAVADVVYPSMVSGTEQFVETFLSGRLDRERHAAGLSATVSELNELAVERYGSRVPALDPSTCDELLRDVGADTADEDPAGTTAERVRYFVVDDLLLALYASPTGGELVGIENPQGHPGGTDSYQRGPQP